MTDSTPATAARQVPTRIQRRRASGWRMPKGAVYVGRPSRWGNPYAGLDHDEAVHLFVDMLTRAPHTDDGREQWEVVRVALAGRDLACWCPLDKPCHADVLLFIANAPVESVIAAVSLRG